MDSRPQLAGIDDDMMEVYIDYKYNADGLRTQKVVDDQGNFSFVTYDYIWADGKLVSQTDGTDVLYFLYDGNGSPIGFTLNDSAMYLYIKNLQGDITGIADENGAVIVSYTYDSWGKLLSITGSATYIGYINPLRYRGYYYDTETQLYYLQSRYYHPVLGRFINADGIVNGANLIAYCGNNPTNQFDPTGTFGRTYHYNHTLEMAMRWFKEGLAKEIARGDIYIDEKYPAFHIYSKSDQSWHFNINGLNPNARDTRDIRAEEEIDKAKSYLFAASKCTSTNSRNKNLLSAYFHFGNSLHAQQDKISHSGPYGNICDSYLFYYHLPTAWQDNRLIKFDSPERDYYALDNNGKWYNTGLTTGELGDFITEIYFVFVSCQVEKYGLERYCLI